MRGVSLDWVVDRDTDRAAELAEPWGAGVLDSVAKLPEIDIAVVAVGSEEREKSGWQAALNETGCGATGRSTAALRVSPALNVVWRMAGS